MPDTMVKLVAGTCPLVPTDVYTALVKVSVVAIDVTNPTVAAQFVTVKFNGNILFSVEMPPTGGLSWHGPQVLEIGHALNIVADSASCEYQISGVEIT